MVDFRQLLETPYAIVEVAEREHILRFRRTGLALRVEDVNEMPFGPAWETMTRYDAKVWALLVDLRDAPSRNDADFESSIAKWQMGLFRRFDRTAVVVRTAAGRLQLLRMASAAGRQAAVFLDETEALRHLTEAPGPVPQKPKAPAK